MARARVKNEPVNFIDTVKGFEKDTSRKHIEEQLRLSFNAHHKSSLFRKKPKVTAPDPKTGTTALIEAVKLGNFDAVDLISQYISNADYALHVEYRDTGARKCATDYARSPGIDSRIVSRLALKDADLSRVTPFPTSSAVILTETCATTREQKEPSSSESLQRLLNQCVKCTDQEEFLSSLKYISSYETTKLEKKQDKISLIPNICKGILLAAAKESNFKVIEFLVSANACEQLKVKNPNIIWNTLLHLCVGTSKNSPDEMQANEKYAFIAYFLPLVIQLQNGVIARCSPEVEAQIKAIIAPTLSTSGLDKLLNTAKLISHHTRHLSDPGPTKPSNHFKPHHTRSDKSADHSLASSPSPSDDRQPTPPTLSTP